MNTQTFTVKGMTCGGCVRHVEKALKATPGVAAVTVDLASATATVEGTATFEAMAAQVADAGYDMVPKP
ncbi:MAG TPA: heavy metal-associated domain-containing protein [Holophagaceae bacterium]